ncbi:MAG: helix-turn-helix domain-containing protein [Pseudomonadota bacterium]
MSLQALTAIWNRPPCKGGDLLCLLAIADNADDDGFAWPSVETIARKAAMSERGARKCIRKLIEMGLVEVKAGGGRNKTNAYQITTNGMGDVPDHINPEQNTGNSVQGLRERNPEQSCINPEQSDRKPGTPVQGNSHEPSLEQSLPPISPPQKKISSRPRKSQIPADAVISDKMLSIAADLSIPEQEAFAQFELFKDNAMANARMYADWDAAWRNWLKSPYFKPVTAGGRYGRENTNTDAELGSIFAAARAR